MINREEQKTQVITYSNTTDSYGQRHQTVSKTRDVYMVVHYYSHQNVENPTFAEVQLVGLTTDDGITTNNDIIIDSIAYRVLFVIRGKRYNQVMMKEK